jgi:outer membrane receptor for ferrienterochelin and colicin
MIRVAASFSAGRSLLLALALCTVSVPATGETVDAQASAQATAAGGTLAVRVTDTLGGLLPGATVTLTGPLPEETVSEVVTDGAGQAEIAALAPGRYTLVVAMPGFATAGAQTITIAAGRATERAVELGLETHTEQVTVTVDATEQRLDDNFTETLRPEEIEQLPDDPEEAAALIAELAGPDAEIRINGFEGGELPPKSQIQAIRIRQDPFSPDSGGAGRPRVEIITKPGSSHWEHSFNAGLRDQSIDARNPFSDERGEGQTRRLRWSTSGPLIPNRTSLAFTLASTSAFDLQPIIATPPGGASAASVSQRNRGLSANVRLEHALTAAHMLRVEYDRRKGDRDNLGVGEFSLPERAYDANDEMHQVRVSDIGTFGKKAFNELRFEVQTRSTDRTSQSSAVTVDVANAFTAGGAQLEGGTRTYEIDIEDDLELIVSDRHKVRVGIDGEYARVRSTQTDNTTGRFSFPSLEAFAAGRPIQFVQRVGDPSIAYSRYRFAWYVSDELRLRKNLQLALGVRHDLQSFTSDWANFGPRASIAWTPGALPRTTIRAGGGIFTEWYDPSLHEQTLRLDGIRQRDLIVSDPGWPDPFAGAGGVEMPPPSIIRASEDLRLPTTRRVSIGLEHTLSEAASFRFNVFDETTSDRLRSVDLNAPIDGLRPDPRFARVTEIRSIGRAERRGVEMSTRVRVRDLFGTLSYRWARDRNDADGALSLPADSANLAAEWGPSSGDVRHRLFGYMRLRLPLGFAFGLNGRLLSSAPYTVRTGFDDNGDQVTNDRPAGVGRNTARGSWQKVADLRLGWTVGGHDSRRQGANREARPRSGVDRGTEIYVQVSNLFNTTNFSRYGAVVTSDYFGLPTAALPGRRMELGLRVFF